MRALKKMNVSLGSNRLMFLCSKGTKAKNVDLTINYLIMVTLIDSED
jgi:hypothetical protein